MPYGTPLTEQERIDKHMSLYGEMPPSTRRAIPQTMNTSSLTYGERNNLIMMTCGAISIYIFVEFILPRLMDE